MGIMMGILEVDVFFVGSQQGKFKYGYTGSASRN